MPLSNDPAKAEIQKRNLKPYAARRHGAFSPTRLAPLRDHYTVELTQAFPSASTAEISLLAHRQAQLHVLAEWMDERGLFANRQRGVPFPAVLLADRIAAQFEKQFAALRERERASRDHVPTIEEVLAESYRDG
jgi:hypothetical protein